MQFKYEPFDVEFYLKQKVQPIFLISELKPATNYYTLQNPYTGEFAVTTSNSEAVRVPVFGVTARSDDLTMTHGSLLTIMGVESAAKFISQLPLRTTSITCLRMFVSKTCHELPDGSFRAYFGLVVEADSR
jgi:hypothetical protein